MTDETLADLQAAAAASADDTPDDRPGEDGATRCDSCHQVVVRDRNGYWCDPPEGDSWCDANPKGHTVDGAIR